MGNEIRTVRFPHKMHRRRVSFCNQCDIHRSHLAQSGTSGGCLFFVFSQTKRERGHAST